ncbi:MAG: NAD(P)/FAD-dependent oxidoreductase [Spirochaetota bacterium]
MKKKRIAVIGGGIAGITASFLLQQKHLVSLFEKNEYVGGHTNTVIVPDGDDAGTPIDTGFSVFSNSKDSNLMRLFNRLGIKYGSSDLSFSYTSKNDNIIYSTNGPGRIFSQRRKLFSKRFWNFSNGIVHCGKLLQSALQNGDLQNKTVPEAFYATGLSPDVFNWMIVPMASTVWSSSARSVHDLPAEAFVRFMDYFGLLTPLSRHRCHYIHGGSKSYIEKFLMNFKGTVHKHKEVSQVRRKNKKCTVICRDGYNEDFDYIVMATHADQALDLLHKPTDDEKELLGVWKYTSAETILHTDTSFLPPIRRAWSSWNVKHDSSGDDTSPTVTYWMNPLQQLDTRRSYCVTINPPPDIDEQRVLSRITYHHPIYTFKALDRQNRLQTLNGNRNTYFCGSYFGNGLHVDACDSAVRIAQSFGIEL